MKKLRLGRTNTHPSTGYDALHREARRQNGRRTATRGGEEAQNEGKKGGKTEGEKERKTEGKKEGRTEGRKERKKERKTERRKERKKERKTERKGFGEKEVTHQSSSKRRTADTPVAIPLDPSKACVALINHDSSLTGAPVFLYSLAVHLQERHVGVQVVVFDVQPHRELETLIGHKLRTPPIFYGADPARLQEALRILKPLFIFSNSLNPLNLYFHLFDQTILDKTLFQYHEADEGLPDFAPIRTQKIMLTSQDQVQRRLGSCSDCCLSHNFIALERCQSIDAAAPVALPRQDRIVFGMVGTPCRRKGVDIFQKVARKTPQHLFIWVGGDHEQLRQTANFLQVTETSQACSWMKVFDYFLLSSRQDPCPTVLLEALYLGLPSIVLEGNVLFTHPVLQNLHVIRDHDNQADSICHYINTMSLQKGTRSENLRQYVLAHFTRPNFLNPLCGPKSTVLILTIHQEKLQNETAYYRLLVDYARIRYSFQIDVVLIVSTNFQFDGRLEFVDLGQYKLFGVHEDAVTEEVLQLAEEVSYDKIIFAPNKGFNIGPLLIGLQACRSEGYEFILHTHSETNRLWREGLNTIFNHRIDKIGVDTVVSQTWTHAIAKDDGNLPLLRQSPEFFPVPKNFDFVGRPFVAGVVFGTRMRHLQRLILDFETLYLSCTDLNSDDIYWRTLNADETVVANYRKLLEGPYNLPLSPDIPQNLRATGAKNYFEFLQKGFRGVPDGMFEHAMERYLGYLLFENKAKVLSL